MPEIREILEKTRMTQSARALALRIFEILAKAEARAHRVPVDQVHFHEVGAVDSIVDIVSAAVCLDNLGFDEVIVPFVCEGSGTVRCQHGILPVPVPAVQNICAGEHLRMKLTNVEGELVTPTGAAIAAAVRTTEELPESYYILRTGIGAGKRTYNCPGFLRLHEISWDDEAQVYHSGIRTCENSETDTIIRLESNIDDCSGEILGFVLECLMKAGARDVHYSPVFMKKNRPGWLLTVICDEEAVPEMERLIFLHTTTIGIRRQRMERTVLAREERTISTSLGDVRVKLCPVPQKTGCYPEYESIASICRQTGRSYEETLHQIRQEIKEILEGEQKGADNR